MIEIDGSYGEGGGQILRSALQLATLMEEPFFIYNIRKKRRRPGLRPQHLACVRAARAISNAKVHGDEVGSLELEFSPERLRGGAYTFDIGSAGSTGLVLQTLILPLFFAKEASYLEVRGGTHVPWSPCFHYISEVYDPVLMAMGGVFALSLKKWGFYPTGGGVVEAHVTPSKLRAIAIEKGGRPKICMISAASSLPSHVVHRQVKGAMEVLKEGWRPSRVEIIGEVHADAPGSVLFVWICYSKMYYAGFTGLGEKGVPAERVGKVPAMALKEFLESGASIDPWLSDQLILPALFSRGVSRWRTNKITNHFRTNVWLTKQFGLDGVTFKRLGRDLYDVQITGV